jgi:hypothetical protein
MLFEVEGEIAVMGGVQSTAAAVDHLASPVATRLVWALSVTRPASDPERDTRPQQVIWLGDPALRVPGEGQICAYCNQFDLSQCPGMEDHAYQFGLLLSTGYADKVIEVGAFTVAARLTAQRDVIGAIEAILASRSAGQLHVLPAANHWGLSAHGMAAGVLEQPASVTRPSGEFR